MFGLNWVGKGNGSGSGGGLRVARNSNLALARQQIIDYTGQDYLGMAASLKLTTQSVAQLEDTKRYIAEQKELLAYAVKKLESLTNDAVQIERMLSEIVAHQLKSRAEVDSYLSKANLAGDKYAAETAKISQHHANQQKLIAGDAAGSMALDNVRTKMQLLAQKQRFDSARASLEVNQKAQQQAEAANTAHRAKQAQEAALRRQMLNNGTGNNNSGGNGFTRFKSLI